MLCNKVDKYKETTCLLLLFLSFRGGVDAGEKNIIYIVFPLLLKYLHKWPCEKIQ